MPFFPNFLMRDLLGWTLALGVLAAVSALFPWELGVKADPFAPAPAGITPEWYFVFMFQTLKYIPAKVLFLDGELLGVFGFGLAGVLLLIVPFIDRKSKISEVSKPFIVVAVLALLYIIAMTIISYVVPQTY